MPRQGGGCSLFPLVLFVVLAMLFFGRERRPEREPEINPRRPPLEEPRPVPGLEPPPEYGIEDLDRAQDSQGTAFAISGSGLWLTAEHVVRGCDRIGLSMGPGQAQRVVQIYQSQVSDAALIADGMPSQRILPLAEREPAVDSLGYHMGYPAGVPAVVQSRLIGPGSAVRGPSRTEPVLAWAEVARVPEFGHALGGISGGPTLDESGNVVGINSAASERRGRVLTTRPDAGINLVRAARHVPGNARGAPITRLGDAVMIFEQLAGAGAIRPVYCDVSD